MFDQEKRQHSQQTVLVDIPGQGRLVGFITSTRTPQAVIDASDGEELVAVYLPMSYMVGGYTLFLPRAQVTEVDWSFEDAMRFTLTAGVSQSQARPRSSSDKPTL